MNAEQSLHQWLTNVLPRMHKKRRESLGAIVGSALQGGVLTVTGLGRSLVNSVKTKHNIKRADRLVGNKHLQEENKNIYKNMCREIIRKDSQAVILVDWSDVDSRCKFFILRAALAVRGRSITIYEEVHELDTKEKRSTHKRFLENLKEVLPAGCKAIIVTDAGFRGPWFKEVLNQGWDFVGRVRNRETVQLQANTDWIGVKLLHKQASRRAKRFIDVILTQSNQTLCSLVLYKSKPQGRIAKGKMGNKKANRTSVVKSKSGREPWVLATSIDNITAKQVVKIYSTRMQIEESFRDLKSVQFGLSLYHNNTCELERMKNLLLIGTTANTFAWILGKIAKLKDKHRQYQANTSKNNILSNCFLGIQIFRDLNDKFKITKYQLLDAQKFIMNFRHQILC